MLIPKERSAVFMLGPIDGGRKQATHSLFFGNEILCTEIIRKALGSAAKDNDEAVFELARDVIKAGVENKFRIVVNAALVDHTRRKRFTTLFPRFYHIFYIVCYKPMEERIRSSSNKSRDFHTFQERKWQSNKSDIMTGDFGLATVLIYPDDRIDVEG